MLAVRQLFLGHLVGRVRRIRVSYISVTHRMKTKIPAAGFGTQVLQYAVSSLLEIHQEKDFPPQVGVLARISYTFDTGRYWCSCV
jgi:hypothetical protein